MNLFFPNTTGIHSLLRASIFSFPSISVHKTCNKLLLGCHADSIRVEFNDDSDAKSGGGDKIDSIDKCSGFCLEPDECVEVIVVGSRKDAILDFCSGSPFLSPALRFWNVVGLDSKQARLQRRFTKQDHTLRIMEEFSEQQSSCKAVILVASAAYGLDHITALNVLNNIKSGNGLVVGIILKPFSFEGQRRQDEVKDLVEKLQKLANFCIVLDTNTLLENDLVTLDEALRTSNNAVLMAMNVIPILISERHVKLLSTKDNSTRELQVPGFKKTIESHNKARIGFGAGYNVKTSLLRAVNDCPFLGVDVKDMDGVLLCIFSSSDVTDCGDANTILQTVQVTMRCNSEIIVSVVHEPNLDPNAILTTVIAFGDTRQQLAPKNGIFSNLGQHFPFIFNIFKKKYQQPINTEEAYSSSSHVFDAMNSLAINDVPDANSLDDATETDVYSGKIQPLLGNSDEEFGSSSINSEDTDELWEADSISSFHDLNVEGPQMFKRELLTGGIQWPSHSTELSKFGANFSESSALVESVSIYKLPVGVKQSEKSDDNLLTSNIKHGADGRVDENKKKQPHASPSVPRSGLAEAGVYATADFDNNGSAFNKGNHTINSKKQGVLSIRAASMLESERDAEKKWSRVVEMKYRGGIYQGRSQGGLPEGKGRLLLGDGSIYDGMWRYGKRSGLGTFCFNNGDVFQGSWRDDVMHGKGWFYFHTGDRWFVHFWKGKANGEGRFYSKLGEVFFGHFKEGWRHGHFLRINVDGTRSQEVWDEGVLVSDEPLDLDTEDENPNKSGLSHYKCMTIHTMQAPIIPLVSLKGSEKAMPVIGMGTASYPPADLETTKVAILEAIKAGYRHFDTAFAYGSEKALGEAIAEAVRVGLIESRDQLFITTKLWCSFAEPTQIIPACKLSLRNLQLDYVDLYLIHWPIRLTEMVSKTPVVKEIIRPLDVKGVWKSMEECKNLGLTKAIGLSNFSCKMVQEILSIANIPPAVNQVEINPVWQQKQLRDLCREKGIHVTAYSPLGANNTKWGDNRIIESDVLSTIASDRGKTNAQVALRWAYEQGVSIVTKSFNKERMKENLQIFDWSLAKEDLEKIGKLPQHKGVTLASVLGPHDLVLELDAQV